MAQKDAWRAYYELALGLTETSRKKAMKIVKDVAGKGGGTADQLQELVNTAVANREAISRMVKVEVDRALGRVGLATMDEVDELTKRVRQLERELAEQRAATAEAPAPDALLTTELAAGEPGGPATAPRRPAKTVAKKAVAKKAVAKKATTGPVVPAAAQDTTAPEEIPPVASAPVPVPTMKKTAAKKTAVKASTSKATAAKASTSKASTSKATAAKASTIKKATPTKSMKPAKASVTRKSVAERAK